MAFAGNGPIVMLDIFKSVARALAVTLALTAGALVIVTTLYVLVRFAAVDATVREVADWYRVDLLIVGTAALAGLLADSARALAAILWHTKPDPRIRLTKIMRQNLA